MASSKEKIVLNTKFGKIIEFDDTRFGGKEYVVFDKNGDFVEKFINFNKAKDCLYSMKENKITDVKGIVNKILEGANIRQVLCNESKRWVFEIYLDDLPDGNLVGESDENEDFETREEAEQEAKGFLAYLCKEYNRKQSDFRIEYYQIDV